MKKVITALLCAAALLFVFPQTARADSGPKPSVVVDFKGLEGETYYATLLSSAKSTGPYSALSGDDLTYAHYREGDAEYDIFLKFAAYEDADGYYFIQFLEDCSQSQQLSWTYYPPAKFKILLYFPAADRFVVSGGTFERYAFDSYYTAELTGGGRAAQDASVDAVRSYDFTGEILSLLARILLTVAVELGIALLFGFRERRQFRFIVIVNAVTQIALNVALNVINYRSGELAFVAFYILLELAVFAAEAVLYTWYLRKYSEKKVPGWKPGLYALASNAASFALGLFLALKIPGIFQGGAAQFKTAAFALASAP